MTALGGAQIHVDNQPSLGPRLLQMETRGSERTTMTAVRTTTQATVNNLPDSLVYLVAIHQEIAALRADLASRTLTARLTRLWKGLVACLRWAT